MKANCEYCGSLDFWIGLYGVPVHKQSCPHRDVQFHQGDTSTLRTAQALKNIIDAYDHYTTSPMVEPESMVFEEILKAKTGHQDPKLYTQQEMDEAMIEFAQWCYNTEGADFVLYDKESMVDLLNEFKQEKK